MGGDDSTEVLRVRLHIVLVVRLTDALDWRIIWFDYYREMDLCYKSLGYSTVRFETGEFSPTIIEFFILNIEDDLLRAQIKQFL